uniref:Cytochrome c oxidase subunit 3 n=1 Tax=Endeis spinosa TaxID=136194 RepID=Q535F8_9CHEL|nr:cytochrome c oxidase subunit III [Endeis spinosa]
MSKQFHPFHIVDQSPWPITGSLGALTLTSGLIELMSKKSVNLLTLGILILIITSIQWWRDVTREATFQGMHSMKVINGLRWGMMLFITSEILFFMSFFWAYFHSSLAPSVEIGMQWPPKGISTFNPMMIPLLNTLILLSSGVTVTWAHHSMMNNYMSMTLKSMKLTVILGIYFTILQGWEYWTAPFSMAESVFGASFFVATGFHGLHVIIGTVFLYINLKRIKKNHMSLSHHFGLEAAIWYWHFVDVVWLFLYMSIYWWGN